MRARSGGGRRVLVSNLRDQPVEIHQGDATVVVPPYGRAELPVVPTGGGHLAELARLELVAVQPLEGERAATTARPRPASGRSRSTSARPRRSGASTKTTKPPEGGS